MRVRANGIDIEVEDLPPSGEPVGTLVLVMGLGMQLIAWPQALLDALSAAGLRVIRFDNRDCGLSRQFDELGVPNLLLSAIKHKLGLKPHPPYTLQDMAADTLGVMDALGVARAHLVGVSMGGMIAQRVALAAPQRVASLTSVMSSSGARRLPGPRADVLRAMFSRPRGRDEAAIVGQTMRLLRAIGSPGFPIDEAALRQHVRTAFERSFCPRGTLRQMAAVAADSARADALRSLRGVPSLVIHGKDDPLVPIACGEDTARRIPGARFVAIAGMGHDLAPGVVDMLLAPLLSHLRSHP